MEEEHTAGFVQPCAQCSEVNWGISDEGHFFCRSCHNVIEKTKEVVESTFTPGSTRISTLGRGNRSKRPEPGCHWRVCEGFQFILRNQADALLRFGVSRHFKDQVLCELWRLYLQRSRQAYTSNPVRSATFKRPNLESDLDSTAESSALSATETDGDTNLSSTVASDSESSGNRSHDLGSVDAAAYLSAQRKQTLGLMSMKKTLALIHLALTWSREPLTLSDLLRLVNEGHVPYINAHEELPEEMRLNGQDALIFRVQTVPSHRVVHSKAQALVVYLQLQAFPPVSRQSLLHPVLLSVRYLMDANLPDELHPWLCRLMECAGMADHTFYTFDPTSCPILPQYDIQTAALIIVTMKFIFGLDDHTEWDLSNDAGVQNDAENMFSLRRWFRLMQAALIRAQQRRDHDVARKQWMTKKPLYPNRRLKSIMMKRKRTAEQVQICFERLSSCPAGISSYATSGFRFHWGDEDGADGPSLHHRKLDRVLTLRHNVLTPSNITYWHMPLLPCDLGKCRSHYLEVEATLPRSYVWLLRLFSFLLDVKTSWLYEGVLSVERRVLSKRQHRRQEQEEE